uniref:Uncharacterized protein n=1 Tax=Kalanchoe fedtschenkoi TaxID=63787 RepID=A0A7N0T5U3_KALFE
MAKKKSNSTPKQQSEPENRQSEKLRQKDSAEHTVAEEKLQNLKSLNAVLVKQAHELRAERSSLMTANGALEVENARLESEKADAAAASGLEKEVVAVVVGSRVGEMRGRGLDMVASHGAIRAKLEREVKELREYSLDADSERDALKAAVAAKAEEAAALKSELSEALNREREVVQVLKKLQKENEAAVRAKMEIEAAIEILAKEMDSLKTSLAESLACNEDFKLEIAEKHALELEKNEKLALMDKLEKEVFDLRSSVLAREAEMNRLQDVLSELENRNVELSQQRDGLLMELLNLKKRSDNSEAQIRELLSEKDVLARAIDESASHLAESEKVRALLQADIAELREAHKTQLGEMQAMVCALKNELEHCQRSCGTHIEEKTKLLTELERLKIELEAVIKDKARADEDIQLEKDNVESLTRSVAELETRMQEKGEEIRRLVGEKSQTIKAKESAEARVELLMKENVMMRKRMEETERDFNKARSSSDKMLLMLKKTTAQLHVSADFSGEGEELHDDGGVNSIEREIEAIKNAFKSREAAMADMRKQLETMKSSVSQAHKGKSLWQLVSTATTIFAAASVAYVSRGH